MMSSSHEAHPTRAAVQRAPISQLATGLIFQLFILVFLPLTLLLLVIAFGSAALHQRAMQTLVGERDERAVRAVAQAINDHIYFRLRAVEGLAARAAGPGPLDPAAVLGAAGNLLDELDGGLAFIAADGSIMGASGDRSVWEEPGARQVKSFRQVEMPGQQQGFLSEPFSHPSDPQTKMVVAAVRLLDEPASANASLPGQDLYLAGAFSVNRLVERVSEGALPAHNQVNAFLVAADGRLVYQAGRLTVNEPLGEHPGVSEALRGENGMVYQGEDEVDKVILFRQIPITGWAFIVEEPWEEATSPLLRNTVFAPLVLVPVLILALVALGFVTRQIIFPMQALAEKTDRLSWGEFEAIEAPVGGVAEIRHLQAGLRHMTGKLQAAQKNLHDYIGAITAGQEDERRRLARDLHDDTIQSLIALKQRVQLLQMDEQNRQTSRALGELEELSEQIVDSLRRLIRGLRPIYLEDLGLVTSLQMLADEAQKKSSIPVQFRQSGPEQRLPPAFELSLYRIAQEALNNMALHSQATRAEVSIAFSANGATLQVSDNGRGFQVPRSPAHFAAEGHYGLLGIHERAELIGARLVVRSGTQEGTHISVIFQ